MNHMENKELIFSPHRRGYFKKSPFYALPMFGKTILLCTKYLARSIGRPADIAMTDEYINLFWRTHFEESFTSLYRTGHDQLTIGKTYIFMSNHESWMDIPAMFGAVPGSLRMISKVGLMKIPILGHAMVHAGFIAINRKNRSCAIKQLDEAKKRLKEGISIWIAPEGTRTRDGVIGPFKKGGFYLARELGMSIVPVFIEGAGLVMPADSMMIKTNQSITVHFCTPINEEDVNQMMMPELIVNVRESIINKQRECTQL
jgi:1-acyl-sn-glycerol-3-phosphate acyltransferase